MLTTFGAIELLIDGYIKRQDDDTKGFQLNILYTIFILNL